MSRIWQIRKMTYERTLADFDKRSPVLTSLGTSDGGSEWRALVKLHTKTFVSRDGSKVERAGPVVAGIRMDQRHLAEAPDPMSIVTLLEPQWIFHPNVAVTGSTCLGHPQPGITLDLVLNQVWAGLMFNMRIVNTRPGETVNPHAAEYVRSNAHRYFPISTRGLLEDPDHDLRNSDWYAGD